MWQPIKNIQITTKTPGGTQTEVFEFRVKLKYDSVGRASPDTTGQKTYAWPDREALFGPGAVIRLTQDATVREGALRVGAEWTWTGQQWQAITGASPATMPAVSPATEWARQMAKRIESRKFVKVDSLRRLNVFTKLPDADATMKEWHAALNQATGQQVEILALMIFLSQFSQIWKGEEFMKEESRKYVARLKQLKQEGVRSWSDELKNVTTDRMEALNAALALSQMDYLFAGEKFREARAAQLLPRVRSLSVDGLKPWADALDGNTLEAAVELIDQDWLFEGDGLKASVAAEALLALQAARSGLKK